MAVGQQRGMYRVVYLKPTSITEVINADLLEKLLNDGWVVVQTDVNAGGTHGEFNVYILFKPNPTPNGSTKT